MDNQGSYVRVRERLEEIVTQVKSKDIPLEKSLDLYEEALRLGGICAELIDRTDFTDAELASLQGNENAAQENDIYIRNIVSPEECVGLEADEETDDDGSLHTDKD